MKSIELLNNIYKGQPVIIVGTGPTLRLLPKNFFDLVPYPTIGLNQSWKLIKTTWNLSIHPELIKENKELPWITKVKDWIVGTEDYHFFKNNKDVKEITTLKARDNRLYIGRGIHTGAIHLAARMGAGLVLLAGCDWNAPQGPSLAPQHGSIPGRVQTHGLPLDAVYAEYWANAIMCRKYLGIPLLTITPILGGRNLDFWNLLEEKSLSPLEFEVVEGDYKRKDVDFSYEDLFK